MRELILFASEGEAFHSCFGKKTSFVDDGEISEFANAILRRAEGGTTLAIERQAKSDRGAGRPQTRHAHVFVPVFIVIFDILAYVLVFHQNSESLIHTLRGELKRQHVFHRHFLCRGRDVERFGKVLESGNEIAVVSDV